MNKGSKIILYGIIIGVVIGALLGGAFPAFGMGVQFLGDIFLHGLFMMVIPLVMTSMIVGITNLGDIRKIGAVGTRTIFYYMATTGMAVFAGLVLVNIVQPGVGVETGEAHKDAAWKVVGNKVTFEGTSLVRFYDKKYEILLSDKDKPQARGRIREKTGQSASEVEVEKWTGEDGQEIAPPKEGSGIYLQLGMSDKVRGKENKTIWDVMRDMIVGLLPKNLVKAMAETQVLPIIIFSLVF